MTRGSHVSHEELMRFALTVARGAGDIVMEKLGQLQPDDIGYKSGTFKDLVTLADAQAEQYVRRRILGRFPDDTLIGEEQEARHGSSGVTWYIDPIDGTTNFVHRIPIFGVSIGVVENGQLVAAVIHAPALRETYHAYRGGGAFVDGKPIRVSPVDAVERSLVATGFADVRSGLTPNNLEAFSALVLRSQAVRRMGAASIDLAYVASGRFEAFWEIGLSSWDVCAGSLLVKEAGGIVTDLDGGDDFLLGRTVLATNGAVHAEMKQILGAFERPVQGGR